ncbi:NADH-quinone oxidoreductase subunit L [Puia dinghuensis]|uniref:NADH dehydrogenase subunit L n=1 Tax=Puia dinghuensis TaxID=1792502 RepID=A0A8J2UIC0_9BACT|nr:NADH-quinone oxidoreductase subunit L [Puia dinghuensis]GGB22226.1 NADH dehydrogenase subunit L [Puia dinghuensis]
MPVAPYLLIVLVPLLPLVGFVVLGLFGRRYLRAFSGLFATGLVFLSTVIALSVAYDYYFISGAGPDSVYHSAKVLNIHWLSFGPDFSIDMDLLVDPISVMMAVIVSLISLMVHIFSLGYMKGEERYATYYAYLSLFTFSMLGLVLSANLLETYIFWELVGCSSYLLIGFYYDRPAAVAAAKKAFIVTRFADLGFLIGILVLSFQAQTLDLRNLIQILGPGGQSLADALLVPGNKGSFLGISALSWGLTLVFIGGAGKSALFPLHIWLPDAMEGPTPVSALIHAATMVVAGVYLVARLYPLYTATPNVAEIILWVGAISAFVPAVIACTQTDIKRILAYSTLSQIGYMMFALGASGFTASLFHLFTHAFFKALLFLCAGVIIHRVHSNEMKDMGGLRRLLPVTHVCFLIACLAIAGIPPFSGFFSKEEILAVAWENNPFIYAIGLVTSGLTAYYMFRLYFSVFWRKTPAHEGLHHGEAPASMKIPLIILAIGAAFAGFIPFSRFITPDGRPGEAPAFGLNVIPPVFIALLGIGIAAWLYGKESNRPEKAAKALRGLYTFAYHKFYIDEIWLFITKKIIFNLIGRPAAWIDRNIVDGFMNGLASATAGVSAATKGVQSGKVQDYAWFFFMGIAGLAILFIYLYT